MKLDVKIVVSLGRKGVTQKDEAVPSVMIKFYFKIWVLFIWICSP